MQNERKIEVPILNSKIRTSKTNVAMDETKAQLFEMPINTQTSEKKKQYGVKILITDISQMCNQCDTFICQNMCKRPERRFFYAM